VRVLVVNTGSSSLKLTLLDGTQVRAEHVVERWAGEHDLSDLTTFVEQVGEPDAVGHRFVHGGSGRHRPALLDRSLLDDLEALSPLAPLHQPRAVAAVRAVERLLPRQPSVACFDTAFHTNLPTAAATYALPRSWNVRWHLRRHGFHGLSHAYAVRRTAELLDRDVTSLRLVTCHLGAGSSLCAVLGGRSVDTTMGFTPLDGLVMATRSGAVDPGLLLWLQQVAGVPVDELADILQRQSGLAGLSGTSGDLRDVDAARAAGDRDAALAYDVFVHRLAAQAAAMTAATGGLDVLVLTGGIGEHAPDIRTRLAQRLAHLGVELDERANETARGDADISGPSARVRTVVVTAREDLQIGREVSRLLSP
jgi:acetate kinase